VAAIAVCVAWKIRGSGVLVKVGRGVGLMLGVNVSVGVLVGVFVARNKGRDVG
jgi:hypothetical protein